MRGWAEVGSKRCYFRSLLEKNCAEYLQYLRDKDLILGWKYEPKTFWFTDIKRGVRSYKPDFFVMISAYKFFWLECKGYMDPKSKTKIKRLKKYFPSEKLLVIRSQKEFHKILRFDMKDFV